VHPVIDILAKMGCACVWVFTLCTSEEIGWEDRFHELFCVEWDVSQQEAQLLLGMSDRTAPVVKLTRQ